MRNQEGPLKMSDLTEFNEYDLDSKDLDEDSNRSRESD
jgi:hypothetical protein